MRVQLHFVADSDDVASTLITSLTSKRYKKVVLQKEAKGQVPGDIVDFLCELDTEHKVYANTEFRHLMFTAEHVLGRTPLNIAGGLGSDSTVKALLKQAARIEGGVQQVLTQADKLGRLPIHSAAGMRRHGIVDLMCNESTAPMDLALAADADGCVARESKALLGNARILPSGLGMLARFLRRFVCVSEVRVPWHLAGGMPCFGRLLAQSRCVSVACRRPRCARL